MLLAAAGPAAASPRWPRPQRYDVDVRWDAGARTLSGSERIAFLNAGPSTLSSVWLRVWPNGYGSCAHRYAHVSVAAGGKIAQTSVGCTALRVRLGHPLAPGYAGAIRLQVRAVTPVKPNRFGFDAGIAYLGNALPVLAVEDAGGASIEPYTDLGDPFYSRSAAWSVRLSLARGLTAASTGAVQRSSRIGHHRNRLRIFAGHARDFAFVIGRMSADVVRTGDGLRLVRYRPVRQARDDASRTSLDLARQAVDQYTAWYGSPGVKEIEIAPPPRSLGPFGAGMEFPGLVLAPEQPQFVAHELAHQWFYSLVGNDQWRSPWLDESFAEFSSRRLPESVVGGDDLGCDPRDPVGSKGEGPLTASMKRWDAAGGGAYYNVVYLGGTCALRALEADLGADWTTAFLRSFVAAHRWQVVTSADFVSALRSAVPAGYDVDGWLRRAEIEP